MELEDIRRPPFSVRQGGAVKERSGNASGVPSSPVPSLHRIAAARKGEAPASRPDGRCSRARDCAGRARPHPNSCGQCPIPAPAVPVTSHAFCATAPIAGRKVSWDPHASSHARNPHLIQPRSMSDNAGRPYWSGPDQRPFHVHAVAVSACQFYRLTKVTGDHTITVNI
jgi:hypothetical protein